MFFTGTDMFEGDGAAATFHSVIKSGGNGLVMAKVYASSNLVAKTPYNVNVAYGTESVANWFRCTEPTASNIGLIGIPSAAVASGCVGWVTIRGVVEDVAFPAESLTGSVGTAIYQKSAGLGGTGSAFIGAVHQVGINLVTVGNESTTGTIYLTGNLYAQSL